MTTERSLAAELADAEMGGAPYRVGVDIGGTFVDVVAIDSAGQTRAAKVPTRPRVFSALQEALALLGIELNEVELLVHGTTVATNTLLEKDGAPTLLITTEGFRDVLEIRRTNKGDPYDLMWSPPPPIIPRSHRLEIDERISWTGDVLRPLDLAGVDRLVRIIDARGIEAVAIIFLHSYVNPAHERELRDILRERRPHLHISISSDVIRSYREFERTATTAANAYIAPVVKEYLEQLAGDLATAGFADDILIMQSNGGLSSLETCKEVPAKTVRSGPAGGAIALAAESRLTDQPNMIGLDIGGSSADISIIWNHEPKWRPHLTVEFGLPIVFPTIDIVSIGSGGGTIAWVDKGQALRVGPISAGSDPGPACYGLGGDRPTSTDAQLLLGRLGSETFLGGRMTVYPELSEQAILEHVAEPLGLSLQDAAAGIVDILTTNMIQAVRLVTIEQGYDPRDFVLTAFGGGGGLYAADIARDLNIPGVSVPLRPGVFSASGVLMADVVHDASRTILQGVEELGLEEVEAFFEDLETTILSYFERESISTDATELQRYADLLYAGQTHTLSVPVARNGGYTAAARREMVSRFHAEYLRRFGHSDETMGLEIVNLRVFGRYRRERGADARVPEQRRPYSSEPKAVRSVYFGSEIGLAETPIYDRELLSPGHELEGPAIVEQMDSTTVIPPGMTAQVTPDGSSLYIRTHAEVDIQ